MKKEIIVMLGLLILLAACGTTESKQTLLPPTPPPAPGPSSGDLAGQAFVTQESYAPPYDVYVDEYDMQIFFLNLESVTDNEFEYSIRVNQPGGNVFRYAYYFTDKWTEFEFPQQTITEDGSPTDWIEGRSQENIVVSRAQFPDGIKWALAFSCKEYNGQWACGCQDKNTCGFWMLQSLKEGAPPGAPCEVNADCRLDNVCIDAMCGKLADIHGTTTCQQQCNFKDATLKTNSGDTQFATPGGGGYTSAGALTWAVERAPAYCPPQEAKVPIKLTKKNYGEKISETYITLSKGQTSSVIKHPAIPTFAFTLKINDVTVECK